MVSGSVFMTMVIYWLSVTEWILRRLFLTGQMLHHGMSLRRQHTTDFIAVMTHRQCCFSSQLCHCLLLLMKPDRIMCNSLHEPMRQLMHLLMQRVVIVLLNFCWMWAHKYFIDALKIQWTSAYLIAMKPDHGRIGEMAVAICESSVIVWPR